MSRLAQDSFISDDEEEVCPLCVEEFDISDKGFKPCPCGYQVCQFCYNNIRQNPQLNGRCPGCRRPYDDESVEYKVVTAEEWRQDHQKQTRREKEKKQKERERKEIEQASRKHLSGMRVIQKNLVYVVGLSPHIPHEELHNTLRGDQFFGQYGKIQKIVVNRRNNGGAGNGGIGVYVTYLKKEDAAKCIAAVDGSMNDGKILRAAYGTTKYCSSYLRNQPCPNPNCMFLHEPGEEADSYTRQDLSTIQHAARQGDMKPGLPRAPTTAKSTVVPKANEESQSDMPEPSALPPTASWANKASPPVQNSKLSRPTTATGSPLRPAALVNQGTAPPLQLESQSQFLTKSVQSQQPPGPQGQRLSAANTPPQSKGEKIVIANPTLSLFENAIKMLSNSSSFKFSFSAQILAKEDMASVQSMPPLFAFVSDKSQNGKMADKQSEAKQEGPRTDSHARQGSRYNFSEKLNNSEHLLEQQQMMQGGSVLGIRSGSTPPPGLFGNGQVRDGQDLISQLVSGGRLKVSLPNVEASVADESLRAPQAQRQAQTQGSSPIPSQPEWALRKLPNESFPPLSEANQNPGSARSEKPTSPSSVIRNQFAFAAAVGAAVEDAIGPEWPIQRPGLGSPSGSDAFAVRDVSPVRPSREMLSRGRSLERRPSSESANSPRVHLAGIHVSLAPSIQTQHLTSTSYPSELSRLDTEATIALPTGPITLSPENAKYSMTLKQESLLTAKKEVNRSEMIDFVDKPDIKMTENYMQKEAMQRLATAPLMQIPRSESPPQVQSQSASPAPSASQEAVKGQKKEKKAKKAKKVIAVSSAAATGGASDSVDDTRSQSETDSAVASSASQQEKPVLDPLRLTKMVVRELEGSNNLTFFKQAITGSVFSPHFTFSQIEFEQAEKILADEITSEMLGGKKLEQLEKEWHGSKKECETLEKKLLKLIKRNRKLVFEV
ncbi:uncharacterized protein V1513DRAFT_438106 [Lipomyces chichibuensis]|uniref:uncharacterized protein n=1 Tax=Lipomyces chichibuensis TaxID=1546026 RepID=UPI003342EB91